MYSHYGNSEYVCNVEEEEQCQEEYVHLHRHHHHDDDDHKEDESGNCRNHENAHDCCHQQEHDIHSHGFVYPPPEYHEAPFPGTWPYPPDQGACQTECIGSAFPPQFDPYVYQPPPPNVYPYPNYNNNLGDMGDVTECGIEDGIGDPPQLEVSDITSPPTNRPQGRLVRVFCKAYKECSLAVIDDKLAIVRADFEDESQQWIKDLQYAIQIRDIYGHPAFKLINKTTQKVLKHPDDEQQEPQLVDYEADRDDDNLFWTESQDFGDGFKTIRMASDTLLNLTVEGSRVILDTWHKKDTQLWKIFPL